MKVTSKIKINQTAIIAITAKAQAALEQTAEALHTEVVQAQVIPRDTGALQNESTFVDTSKVIKAKFLLCLQHLMLAAFTITLNTISKDENPNAKAHWFEDWQKGGKHEDFCNKSFAKI